jgi:hypothetical protein
MHPVNAHVETDTPEKLNYAKMARMTGYLVAMAEALDVEQFAPHGDGPVDTVEFEIRRIKKACGVALPHVLKLLVSRGSKRGPISQCLLPA